MQAIDFLITPLARCQVGVSHVSDNYPIGAKQNVNNYRMVKLHGWCDEFTFNCLPRGQTKTTYNIISILYND